MAADERREHDSFRLWLPARIKGADDKTRMAVGHDMSQKGSLLVTRKSFDVGTTITLTVAMPPDSDNELTIEAKVLRCDRNTADPQGLWPYSVAVEFTEAAPQLEKLLETHAREHAHQKEPPK